MSTSHFPELPVKVKGKKKDNSAPNMADQSWLPNDFINQLNIYPLSHTNTGKMEMHSTLAIVQATNDDATWLLKCLFPTYEKFSDEQKLQYQQRLYRLPGRYELYSPDKFVSREREAIDCFRRKVAPGERHWCSWVLLNEDVKIAPAINSGTWPDSYNGRLSINNPILKSGNEAYWPRPMQICQLQDIWICFQVTGQD